MIKFILDAMYYQIFIFNRDKFILENPHERTIQDMYLQTVVTQCFVNNKSEIWS